MTYIAAKTPEHWSSYL